MTNQIPNPIHKAVREHYGSLAKEAGSCCKNPSGEKPAENVLYPQDLLAGLPPDIANFTAGSGDPITLARIQPGETVLDLGSGGGLDCFLAAKLVGDGGHVIGVDMTPEMLNRARTNAERIQARNVEFREGFLENLPVDDNSIDVILSNCVINLSPDKPRVLGEMFRVLKPGGRIALSDIVTNRPLPEKADPGSDKWCGCISGAMAHTEYVSELGKAGFVDICFEPDINMVKKAIADGHIQVRSNKKRTEEQVIEDIRNWDNFAGNMFIPHMITARKSE